MRSKLVIYVAIGLVAAVALVAGVVAVAGAGSSTSLPAISAADLMAKMGQSQGHVQAVSGEISWTNDLFGDLGGAAQHGADARAVAAHQQRLGSHLGERRRHARRVAGRAAATRWPA